MTEKNDNDKKVETKKTDPLAPNSQHGRLLTLERRKGNHVPFGSIDHAQMLGLTVAEPGEELVEEGWTLIEIPLTARDNYLRRLLKSKVGELLTEPAEVQSQNIFGRKYAPPLFAPKEVANTRLIETIAG